MDKTGKVNKASTINNERRYLSAFFNWMRIEKLIFDNPVESVGKKRTDKSQIDYYTQEEIEKLREGCESKRDRALVEVLRSTGLRVGEFCSVNIEDVDFKTGDVWVRREKGGLNTPAYIDEAAMYYLREYLQERTDDCESLIVGKRAPYSRLKPCGVRAALKDIARRQGMSCKVYPHKFRQTLGMTLKNKGYDLGVIQEVLGHTSPATTSKYYAESTSDTLRSIRQRAA